MLQGFRGSTDGTFGDLSGGFEARAREEYKSLGEVNAVDASRLGVRPQKDVTVKEARQILVEDKASWKLNRRVNRKRMER